MKKIALLLAVMRLALALASGVAFAASLVGTSGPDSRSGTNYADEMYGLGGSDPLRGLAGYEDEVYGGSGNDTIHAQDGRFDYVDCGLYASATSTAGDYDTADVDVGLDFTVDCERRF